MTNEPFWSAFPVEAFERLIIPELIKTCVRCLKVVIRKNFFADVLGRLSDELDNQDLEKFKEQVTRGDSYLALVMRKRMNFGLVAKDTGPVIEQRLVSAMLKAEGAGRGYLTFKEVRDATNGR